MQLVAEMILFMFSKCRMVTRPFESEELPGAGP